MRTFTDRVASLSLHALEMAIITDAKGKLVGRIAVRHTKSPNGWNSETGIAFSGAGKELYFNTTYKTKPQDHTGVFTILDRAGFKVLDGQEVQFVRHHPKTGQRVAKSVPSCQHYKHFKLGQYVFNIYWV